MTDLERDAQSWAEDIATREVLVKVACVLASFALTAFILWMAYEAGAWQ